jgi:hypothetical protein
MPRGSYQLLLDAADRIDIDPTLKGKFLAIPGMEWNSISLGNHINIFFARHPVPDDCGPPPGGRTHGGLAVGDTAARTRARTTTEVTFKTLH